ncbi:MAG: anhydro-N-acetylmuramic acid kinase [Flavipsychrobacter sp.]|nr:anhydro-N-acetylmuramic acid kinase [Flavipsychrobacter sp.]
MIYKVIGLMSGSSLDGLDIAYVQLDEVRGKWEYQILAAECVPYNEDWRKRLISATSLTVSEFLELDTEYGKFLGESVNDFIARHSLDHKVHFIASHGHTVYHSPSTATTGQIGSGAAIAAMTGLPVINDLRATDVALGGQGAPIVPIGDRLLFGNYKYLLNIGGIANLTVQDNSDNAIAFDVCPANQILNELARRTGREMDENGTIASGGALQAGLLKVLEDHPYYTAKAPKSLSNEMAMAIGSWLLQDTSSKVADLLHTACHHVADQVVAAINNNGGSEKAGQVLVTGGGAFNTFLLELLRAKLDQIGVEVVVPEADVVKYKEALVMALIGTLRWREEVNVLSSVTGATRDSVSGALWLG